MIQLSSLYSVRELRYNDLKMVLEWRNSDRIHSVMLTEHKITWEEHLKWFESTSQLSPRRQLIFQFNNRPIGYIGYNNFNEQQSICSPGAYLGETTEDIPIDAALYLFYFSIEYAFNFLKVKKLKTEVFKTNKKAWKLDKLLGYQITGEDVVLKNGVQAEIYILELDIKRWSDIKVNFSI